MVRRYSPSGAPATRTFGQSASIRDEFTAVAEAFDELPAPAATGTGFSEKVIVPDSTIGDLDKAINLRSVQQLLAGTSLTGLFATSTSTVDISYGAKNFIVETGKDFKPGMYLLGADADNPSTNYVHGQVLSYVSASGALALSASTIGGSGSISNWVISLSAPGGASVVVDSGTTRTLSANATLIASDARLQYVTPTADALSITMPSETATTKGKPFTFINDGLYSFFLKNSAGTIIGAVGSGDTTDVYLSGVLTTSWFVKQVKRAFQVGSNSITPTYANENQAGQIVAMTENKALAVWSDRNASAPYTHTLYAAIQTYNDVAAPSSGGVSSNSITFSLTGDLRCVLSVTKLDTDKFLVIMTLGYTTGTNNRLRAVVIDTSSGTPVFGTEVSVETTGCTGTLDICTLSTSAALIAYEMGASGLRSRVLTVSGTTITVGSATTSTTFGANSNAGVRCCALSAGVALIAYQNRSTNITYLVCATISGTTITYASSQSFANTDSGVLPSTSPLQFFTLLALNATDAYFILNPLFTDEYQTASLIHINVNSNVPYVRSIMKVPSTYALKAAQRGDDLIFVATNRQGEQFSSDFKTTFLQSVSLAPIYHEPLAENYSQAFPEAYASGAIGRMGNSHSIVNLPGTNRFMCFHTDTSDSNKFKITSFWFF